MSQNEYENLSTKKLKKLISRTKGTLAGLQEELKRRKLDDQHSEIDHLEDHIDEADHNLSNFVSFLKEVIAERKDQNS